MIILLHTPAYLLPKELIQEVSSCTNKMMWFMMFLPVENQWWFRVVLIGLLIGGLMGVYRYCIFLFTNRQLAEYNLSLKVQEVERQRFAKELHDGIGANLALLKMYLQAIGDHQVAQAELKTRSLQLLATSLDDIRSLIHNLHPRGLETLGLVHSINELVKNLQQSGKLMIAFEEQNIPRQLPQSIEINLFRIVQELLQNTIKHANATHVELLLWYNNNALHLTYRDNGQGIDSTWLAKKAGNGLINIQQRVVFMKGTCRFKTLKGAGVSVALTIPYLLSDCPQRCPISCDSQKKTALSPMQVET